MVLESNFANWNHKISNYAKHVLLLLILVFKKWYVPLSLHKPFNIYCVNMQNSIMRCLSLYWHFISFLWIWSFNTTIFTCYCRFLCTSSNLRVEDLVNYIFSCWFSLMLNIWSSNRMVWVPHVSNWITHPVYDYPLEQL